MRGHSPLKTGVKRPGVPRIHDFGAAIKDVDGIRTRACPSSALSRAPSRVNPTCGDNRGHGGGEFLENRNMLQSAPTAITPSPSHAENLAVARLDLFRRPLDGGGIFLHQLDVGELADTRLLDGLAVWGILPGHV